MRLEWPWIWKIQFRLRVGKLNKSQQDNWEGNKRPSPTLLFTKEVRYWMDDHIRSCRKISDNMRSFKRLCFTSCQWFSMCQMRIWFWVRADGFLVKSCQAVITLNGIQPLSCNCHCGSWAGNDLTWLWLLKLTILLSQNSYLLLRSE